MRKTKQILSVILILCLILTIFPAEVWATEQNGNETVNLIQDMKPNDGYKPVDSITTEHCHPIEPVPYDDNSDGNAYVYLEIWFGNKILSRGEDVTTLMKGNSYSIVAYYVNAEHEKCEVTDKCEFEYSKDLMEISNGVLTVKKSFESPEKITPIYHSETGEGTEVQEHSTAVIGTELKLKLDPDCKELLQYAAACKLVAIDFAKDDKGKKVNKLVKTHENDEQYKKKLKTPISNKYKERANISKFCEVAIGNWTLEEFFKSLSGLYVALFKTESNTYVLAIRGTESTKLNDLYTDLNIILGQSFATQFKYIKDFYNKLDNKYKKNLILVGHSLGGALCDYLSILHHHKCFTFNAPTTMMTAMETDDKLFGKSFAGTDEGNLRHDFVNPHDFVGNLVTGSTSSKVAWFSMKGVILDSTTFVTDQSKDNNIGKPGAKYHPLENMLKYIPGEDADTVTFEFDLSQKKLIPSTESGYIAGTTIKPEKPRWKLGHSYYYGTSKKDKYTIKHSFTKPISEFCTHVFSGDGDDDITITGHGINFQNILCGGRGNDTFHIKQSSKIDYYYFKGDGHDKIDAVGGTSRIYIYGYTKEAIMTALSERTNQTDEKGNTYSTFSLSKTDSISICLTGTKCYELYVDDSLLTTIKRTKEKSKTYQAKCPVNMNIYDASGNLVLELLDGTEMDEVRDYGLFSVYEQDGEYVKSATLFDEGYTVKLIGTDEGTMEYSVVQTIGDSVETRIVEDIPVKKEAVYTAVNDFTNNTILKEDINGTTNDVVYHAPESISLSSTQETLHYLDNVKLTASVYPAEASQYVTWNSSDTDVVYVDEDGAVVAVGAGTATITATSPFNEEVKSECQITVSNETISLENTTISDLENNYIYTGNPIEPIIEVKYGEHSLVEDSDYTVKFENNMNIGTATVTITGEGYFQGTITRTFDIRIPTVEEKVQQLVEECLASDVQTDRDKALWFHDWLIYNANYDHNYTQWVSYQPEGVLLNGLGVCQSYSDAYSLLLTAAGIENIVVSSETMDHAWNIVKIDGVYTHIDCTWNDPNSGGLENHFYFGLGDEEMLEDHIWDRTKYPQCQKLKSEIKEELLPGPYTLFDPVVGIDYTLIDSDNNIIKREDIEKKGGNTLLVFGRSICSNTKAFLDKLSDWINILKQHNVNVIAVMEDSDQAKEIASKYPFSCTYTADYGYENGQFNTRIDLDSNYTYPQIVLQNSQGQAYYYSTGYVYEPEKVISTAIQTLPQTEQVGYSPVHFYTNEKEMKNLIQNALANKLGIIKLCNLEKSYISDDVITTAIDFISEVGATYGGYFNWYYGSPNGDVLILKLEYTKVMYTTTVNNSYADGESGTGQYAENEVVTIHAGKRDNYRFSGWTSLNEDVVFENASSETTTFIMPGKNVEVTANWMYIGDNNSSTEASSTPMVTVNPTISPEPTVTVKPIISSKPTVNNGGNGGSSGSGGSGGGGSAIVSEPIVTVKPTETPKPTVTKQPLVSPEPMVTKQPIISPEPPEIPKQTEIPKPTKTPSIKPNKGKIIKNSKAKYIVVKKGSTVKYIAPINKTITKVTISDKIKIDGITYKITEINKNAFKNNKHLKTVIIGKGVKKIGSKAFYNCEKLNKLIIKSTKLKEANVGEKAFTKAGSSNYKKLKVKVPVNKYSSYKKFLKKKGLSSKAQIKKL